MRYVPSHWTVRLVQFVATLDPLGPKPDLTVASFEELAATLM